MDLQVARRIVARSSALRRVERVVYLPRGYSQDRKYVLWEGCEPRYLLRLSAASVRERRRAEFALLGRLRARGVPCSEPIAFGDAEEGRVCYALLSYLPGECAEDALPHLSEEAQFAAGRGAGQALREIHEIPCPDPAFDWAAHRAAKYQRMVRAARDLGLTFHDQERVERSVEGDLGIMAGRPSRLQHDDYHPGNLILRDGAFSGVIDFNRCDWGDPLHDFCKVPWFGCPVSRAFSRGQVLGYFPQGIPGGFWRLYNLYVAVNLHGSLVWQYHNDPRELGEWQRRVREIAETHDFEGHGAPAWFA